MCDLHREAIIEDARRRLQALKKSARATINWNDPEASDPRDRYEASIEFVIGLLNFSEADPFLDSMGLTSIVRKGVLPALRLGRPPKKQGRRGADVRYRQIAAVVSAVCR